MKTYNIYIIVILISLININYACASDINIGKFSSITGTFGEYRPGHFHAGIDFSTTGQIGKKVYLPFDAELVRIKSKRRGYGNALYFKADDGYIYIFAHLSEFAKDDWKKYMRVIGGKDKDSWPEKPQKVKKGELIGFTGESGAGYPHLHFEVRKGFNTAVNPLKKIKNTNEDIPYLNQAIIYPLKPDSLINGKHEPTEIGLTGPIQPIKIYGKIGIGIKCYYLTKSGSKLIPYEYGIETGDRHFYRRFDRIYYSETNRISRIYDIDSTSLSPTYYTLFCFKRKGEPDFITKSITRSGDIDDSIDKCRVYIKEISSKKYYKTILFNKSYYMDFNFDGAVKIEGWNGSYLIKVKSSANKVFLNVGNRDIEFKKYKNNEYYLQLSSKKINKGLYSLSITDSDKNKLLNEEQYLSVFDKSSEIISFRDIEIKLPLKSVYEKTGNIIYYNPKFNCDNQNIKTEDGIIYFKETTDFKENIQMTVKKSEKENQHLGIFYYDKKNNTQSFAGKIDTDSAIVKVKYLRSFFIGDDVQKPVIGISYWKNKNIFCIETYDKESGIDEQSITVRSDDEIIIPSEYDPDRKKILCNFEGYKNKVKITVSVSDGCGNSTEEKIDTEKINK